MKVVFDTNVLISAIITTTGISQHVFAIGLKRHTVILSDYILQELESKLIDKLHLPPKQTLNTINFLKKKTIILSVESNPKIRFEDKNDIPILSLLESAKAHYLVTGDKKLLELKKFSQTLILTPREALRIL